MGQRVIKDRNFFSFGSMQKLCLARQNVKTKCCFKDAADKAVSNKMTAKMSAKISELYFEVND